jgi:hypothetical protein
MEKKYFSLGTSDNSRIVKVIRVIFGILCIAVALYWVKFNIQSVKSGGTIWITILFLLGFGFYQIWSGIGKATRFIEIGEGKIRLKKNAILAPVEMPATGLEKIEIRPLNVIFCLKSNKRILLRFGTTFYDINEQIIDEIIGFAESNSIPVQEIEEKL